MQKGMVMKRAVVDFDVGGYGCGADAYNGFGHVGWIPGAGDCVVYEQAAIEIERRRALTRRLVRQGFLSWTRKISCRLELGCVVICQ